MLDFNAPEFLVVALVALLVIGPKDLPKLLRVVGKWVGRARGVARQFRRKISTTSTARNAPSISVSSAE